jgi:CRISPR-associated protein Csm2
MDGRHIDNILKWENERNIIISASKIGNKIKDDRNFDRFYDCVINTNNYQNISVCKNIIGNAELKEIIDRIKSDEELENFKEFVELLKFFHGGYGIYSNKWIDMVLDINKNNVADVIRYAKILANEFSPIPSSKLRKFYDYVLKVYDNKSKSSWYVDLYRLKSFIAYNIGKESGKDKKEALRKFSKIFEKLIDKISGDEKKFDNFKKFFESVVAYHRAYTEK